MKYFEQIEKYVKNQMSENEKTAFESELAENVDLADEYKFFNDNILLLEKEQTNEPDLLELRRQLSSSGKKYFGFKKDNTGKVRSLIFMASSVAAILVVAFFLFNSKPDLYSEYAVHDEFVVQTKGSSVETLISAVNDFNSGNYNQAQNKFEGYLIENNDLEVKFNLAICKMELNEVDEAKKMFSSEEIQNSVFKEKSYWYLALCELKIDNIESAKNQLVKIESKSYYYSRAQNLLKDLD